MASGTWAAFQHAVMRWEREKIRPSIALRNTAGVLIPLIAAMFFGQPPLALVTALGALNVAYSDGVDPYPIRIRRMLLSSFFCAMAVLVGALTSRSHSFAIIAAMLWAFGAGIVVTLGTTAADLGTISLVTLVIFAARPLNAKEAMIAAAAAFCGGLLQTVLSFALWPVGHYQQDRRVLAGIFGEISRLARSATPEGTAPPATVAFTQAAEVLRVQNRDHGLHAERFHALLSQAERMRLHLLTLARLRNTLQRRPDASSALREIDEFREAAAQATEEIRAQLLNVPGSCASNTLPVVCQGAAGASSREAALLMDSIAGQIRAAQRMVAENNPAEPAGARLGSVNSSLLHSRVEILRANLSLQSVAFRHAVRLALCIAIGEALSTTVDWQRSYWIPMTIAIVLKPDFLSTFSRGVLRLAGTFAGLLVATAIYRFAPLNAITDIAVVGLFTLILRWWGPANYGLLSLSVSGIVVALIAGTGVAPSNVILLRGMNTAIGGVLGMLAYALWPTWERAHVGESIASLLEAYRIYLQAIRDVYVQTSPENAGKLDRARQSARVARTNAEASSDRLGVEPATNPAVVPLATGMLATSHDFIYAAMTLEAGVLQKLRGFSTCLPALQEFLNHIDLKLYSLAAALRGSPAAVYPEHDLRQRFNLLAACLAESGLPDSLIQVEADRMTNALNTFQEQVTSWKLVT